MRPPEDNLDTGPSALHETGPVGADGLHDRETPHWSLPIQRHWLVLVGVCLVTIGALTAWIIFVPPDVDTAASTAVATPTPTSSPTPSDTGGARPTNATTPAAPVPGVVFTPERGALEVRAIPGARIEVDGVDMGPAPLVAPLSVGPHRIRITAPGHATWEETIDVVEGDNPALEAKLRRKRGSKALPSVQELGEGEPPADEPAAPVEAMPKDSPFADDPVAESTPAPAPVEASKPPPPPPPPPAPDPKRETDPFLPVKTGSAAEPALLPTG